MTPKLHPGFLARPITHRALHDRTPAAPENSLAAIARACDAGYPIEVDLQVSGDGTAMVFHDSTLDRLTDASGKVRERSAAELGKLKLMGGHEPIPTLAQALDFIDGRVPLLIELKYRREHTGALEEAVAKVLPAYGGPVAVMSFDPRMIGKMAELMPDLCRGLVTENENGEDWAPFDAATRKHLGEIADFDRVGASFISHDRKDLRSPVVARLKERGIPILCWTVRSPEQERDAREVVDQITFEGYTPTG